MVLIAFCNPVHSNGLSISNPQRLNNGGARDLISFNLSWQNSWNVTGLPGNHDAVWIFIKYRACGADSMNKGYSHALLSMNMTEHTLHSDLVFARPITATNRLNDSSAPFGGAAGNTNHNTGALIRRATIGRGHIVNLPCTLKLTGTATDGTVLDPATEYDIRIFGIEMVQVLAGSFVISSNELVAPLTLNHFRNTYSVTSETGTLALNFKAMTNSAPPACYNATAGTINVPANFPKGVNEFYCMKYEVTQGAYTDFLNTLAKVHIGAPPATVNRNTNNFGNNRHRISYNTSTFWASCDRPDRACNFLSQEDLFAYLDWACLRPMTELEYEKVCRGTALFAADEFPWGSTNNQVLVAANGLSGAENGAETVLTPNANRLVV